MSSGERFGDWNRVNKNYPKGKTSTHTHWYMRSMLEMLHTMEVVAAYLPVVTTSPCWPQSTHEDFTIIMKLIAKLPSAS